MTVMVTMVGVGGERGHRPNKNGEWRIKNEVKANDIHCSRITIP